MGNISIRFKVLFAVAVGIVVALAIVVYVMGQAYQVNVETLARNAIGDAARTFANVEARDTAMLAAAVDTLATRDDLRRALAARDQKRLLELSAPLFADLKENYGITHMYFIDTTGTVVLRAHKPETFGDNLQRVTFQEARDTGGHGAGLELGVTAFALRVVRPLHDPASGQSTVDPNDSGKLAGYLELGEEIDHFLQIMKGQSGDDFGLLLQKDKVDREAWALYRRQSGLSDNWDDQKTYVLAGITEGEWAEEMVYDKPASEIPDEGVVIGVFTEEDDRTEIRGVFPVADAKGDKVGAVFVTHDVSASARAMRDSQRNVVVVIAALALALGIVLSLLLNTLIFGRLDRMMSHMEDASLRLAGGDFDISPVDEGANDEIGKFERFYSDFVHMIGDTLKKFARDKG